MARARLIRALRPPSRGPLCASPNQLQHLPAQMAAAAYRHRGRLFPQGRIAPSAQSIQWPSQGGYEPKGHELGFTAAILGAKRCRSSISETALVNLIKEVD